MGGGSIRKKEWILGGGCLWLREVRTPFLEAAYNFAHDTSGREEYKLVAGPFLYFPTSLLEDIIKVRYHTFHILEEFFNEKYLVLCCLFAERLRQKGTAEGNCASAPASATRGLTFNPFGTIRYKSYIQVILLVPYATGLTFNPFGTIRYKSYI